MGTIKEKVLGTRTRAGLSKVSTTPSHCKYFEKKYCDNAPRHRNVGKQPGASLFSSEQPEPQFFVPGHLCKWVLVIKKGVGAHALGVS